MVVEVVREKPRHSTHIRYHLPALDCPALELLQESVLRKLVALYSVVVVPSQHEPLLSFVLEPAASHESLRTPLTRLRDEWGLDGPAGYKRMPAADQVSAIVLDSTGVMASLRID